MTTKIINWEAHFSPNITPMHNTDTNLETQPQSSSGAMLGAVFCSALLCSTYVVPWTAHP